MIVFPTYFWHLHMSSKWMHCLVLKILTLSRSFKGPS
jgi:hypothetical protein